MFVPFENNVALSFIVEIIPNTNMGTNNWPKTLKEKKTGVPKKERWFIIVSNAVHVNTLLAPVFLVERILSPLYMCATSLWQLSASRKHGGKEAKLAHILKQLHEKTLRQRGRKQNVRSTKSTFPPALPQFVGNSTSGYTLARVPFQYLLQWGAKWAKRLGSCHVATNSALTCSDILKRQDRLSAKQRKKPNRYIF